MNTSSRSLLLRVGVHGAHQLALRGERHFADAREARVERVGLQAGLARGDDQRAFGRVALDRPAAVVLLQHGVVRAIGGRERAIQLEPQRPVDRAAAVPRDLAFRRVPGAAERRPGRSP